MKAVVKKEPKPGIQIAEIPVPKISSPDEVLIRVKAVGICGSDVHIYEWVGGVEHLTKNIPMVLGHEFSGELAEVGSQVFGYRPGDRVTSETGLTCGRCIYCSGVSKEENLTDPARLGKLWPRIGIGHLGMLVDDLDETVREMKAKGAEFFIQPQEASSGTRFGFVKGPEEDVTEILQRDKPITY
jgi:threonine dehydrogenase-like Zn-dependent dehydrogenase